MGSHWMLGDKWCADSYWAINAEEQTETGSEIEKQTASRTIQFRESFVSFVFRHLSIFLNNSSNNSLLFAPFSNTHTEHNYSETFTKRSSRQQARWSLFCHSGIVQAPLELLTTSTTWLRRLLSSCCLVVIANVWLKSLSGDDIHNTLSTTSESLVKWRDTCWVIFGIIND